VSALRRAEQWVRYTKPKPKSGRCVCDTPALQSVCDVREFGRKLGRCTYCTDWGYDLIAFGWQGRLHVRCLIEINGLATLCASASYWKRARICCLSRKQLKFVLLQVRAAKTHTVDDLVAVVGKTSGARIHRQILREGRK
jgi:hypothetical protein